MAKKKATIEAMFEEIKDSLDNFENNSSKRLSDYKELIEDIKMSVEICEDEINNKNKDEYSKTMINDYKSRLLPANPYERARVVLRRLKSDIAKLDKFKLMNEGKEKKDYVFVGITKDELMYIKKDIKFLNELFETELKDYKQAYIEIFNNGMSLSEYATKYLDGKKKTAENLVNKIYRMVAQAYVINDLRYSFKIFLPTMKSKRNKRLSEMEEELVSNAILNLDTYEKPDRYFQDMKNAYDELARVSSLMDENGNF